MRGHDEQTTHMFSYVSPEQRVPANHPLRAVHALTDEALHTMSRRFAGLYATTGRPSISPEQLLRALLLHVLYTVRSERLLMEELNYNLLFRWCVGLSMDDPVWHPTTFTKNRDRLLAGEIAAAFFEAVQTHARAAGLLSDEHFTVDGTQLEAWASLKSFRCVDAAESDPPDDPGNPRSTSTGNGGAMTRTSRRPTPRRCCIGRALVHDSKLTVNDPNPEASHRPILYDSGRPSSVIWFRTLHATADSATRPPRDRARSRSPIIDLYRKNAFSTRAWSW